MLVFLGTSNSWHMLMVIFKTKFLFFTFLLKVLVVCFVTYKLKEHLFS